MAAIARAQLTTAVIAATLLAAGAVSAERSVPPSGAVTIRMVADLDDDDANLEPDVAQSPPPSASELTAAALLRDDVVPPASWGVRVLRGGQIVPPGTSLRGGTTDLRIQAARAGQFEWGGLKLHVIEVRGMDETGAVVDLARSHASLTRSPPTRLRDATSEVDDLRILVRGAPSDLPGSVHLTSRAEGGEVLDVLRDLALDAVPCPVGLGGESAMQCAASMPIRAVVDEVDRDHPLARSRSLVARLGGALIVTADTGEKLQTLRVGGPRTPESEVRRYRARLRVHVVRTTPRGALPVGATEEEALSVARREVSRANAMWGACGISFGPETELDVRIVDPPPAYLLAVGCDHGVRASGGTIRFRVGDRPFSIAVTPGDTPAEAARRVASALRQGGFEATVSDNRAISASALGSTDVLVKAPGGRMAAMSPPVDGPISSDASLPVCIGDVELSDGLAHFADADAIAGTVAERTLIKAFDDGDPATIEVLMVASFEGGARIGESFIDGDGGAIRNVVIEDRGAVRADEASSALAHELGHVLLDSPGHPDDYATDTPTRLMDADAMDKSAFGPRRITALECLRARRQGVGPTSSGTLTSWPLSALP